MQMAMEGYKGHLVAGALVLLSVSLIVLQIFSTRRRRDGDGEFPRGPLALPIIGHLHLIIKAPHQVLAELSAKHSYGPIIGLRLGSQPVVVVSSPSLARELLLMHDKTFANRPPYQFIDTLFYGYNSAVIFSAYNSHWARFRKLYTLELFTAKRLLELQQIRHDEVRGLLNALLEASHGGTQAVDVGRLLANMTSNATARLLQSQTLAEAAPELPELIRELEHQSIPALGDFIPWLKCFDMFQLRRMKHLHDRIDKVIESIIQERRQSMRRIPPHKLPQDFLQVILSKETSHEDEVLTTKEIKGIILDILAAGIHTSSGTLEWAIAELIRSPRCLQKLRDEIDAVLDKKKTELINDEDVAKLPYLENTIKEVLRLHPVVPLLIPRISSKACKVDKYTLPKGTQAFVNVWAIGRDPIVWEKPNVFCPERFEGKDMDVRGQHYELLPFGSGRRICPGMRLGLLVLQVTLANLVNSFDWELPHGQSPSSLDMSEKGGMAPTKARPLLAIPKARLTS